VRRILRVYAWPHRWSYLAGFFFLALTNWLTVEIPVRIGVAIDHFGPEAAPEVAAIALMGLGVIVVRTFSRVLIFNPGRDVEYALRQDLMGTLMKLRPAFYAGRRTGDIVNRGSDDMTFARVLVGFGMMQAVNVTLALTMTGWKMFTLSWSLTLATVVPVLIGVTIVRFAINAVFTLHRAAQQQLSAISAQVLDSFQGIATIQGFVAEERFVHRFDVRNRDLFQTRLKGSLLSAFAFPALPLAGNVAVFVVLFVGGPMAIQGEMSVGELAAFVALLGILLPPLRSMGWMLSVLTRGQASVERIFELLDAPIARPEGPTPAAGPPPGGPAMSVRGLHFAYPDAPDTPVLKDVSFDVPGGAVVGVFGRTGSGKSTLVRVLSRSFDPPAGTVMVGGVDVTQLDLEQWRRRLAVAPQRPFLFSDSIADNVGLGEESESAGVLRAVSRAALDPDIESLPDGLDTIVGERGIMLSGGQRQRVALARALYREDADIVLLDDVLSAVDHDTERRLVGELSAIRAGTTRPTTFIVSHRVSAIRHADRILVLEDGALIDQGTHDELVARPGPYRQTYFAQQPKGEVAK
jgi:ATP-binding cassette, subfamily B, multidrug efflux pump